MFDLPPADTRALAHWIPLAAARPAMSPAWWPWVASRDSLTARLISAGGHRPFRVRLVNQHLDRPRRDEALALGLPPARLAWVREVALCLDERPWVMARSVVPLDCLHGQRLDRLGERSLGSWLFRQPDLVRGPLEVSADPPPFQGVSGPWARRSLFRHRRFVVLVQEFFLDRMADDLGLPSR
ncbi:chorismate--pyruvate lyase [Halomonas fontilapidosi]|uniref:Probable chorismate pyruvate-lyase n=1 Tax=Halomonas fontilapidosi TaxID=616675 RepID=A0A7W5DL72_9GAMM|nr:chorismate--pyruvate lyase [Halomonas fontilapidosi]